MGLTPGCFRHRGSQLTRWEKSAQQVDQSLGGRPGPLQGAAPPGKGEPDAARAAPKGFSGGGAARAPPRQECQVVRVNQGAGAGVFRNPAIEESSSCLGAQPALPRSSAPPPGVLQPGRRSALRNESGSLELPLAACAERSQAQEGGCVLCCLNVGEIDSGLLV